MTLAARNDVSRLERAERNAPLRPARVLGQPLRASKLFRRLQTVKRWCHYAPKLGRRVEGPRVAFGPGPPPYCSYVIWCSIRLLGGSITDLDDPSADVRVAWLDKTWAPEIENALNGRCTDISKGRVNDAQRRAFGYGAAIDPRRHAGPAVCKSEINFTHDGRVVICPTDPEPDVCFQRLVRNELGDGRTEDLRVVIAGQTIPLVYRKRRPVELRFSNTFTEIIVDTEDVFSAGERIGILSVARDLGLDFGELDVLRDVGDSRIYVVDANKTPMGPPKLIRRRAAVSLLAEAMRPLLTGATIG